MKQQKKDWTGAKNSIYKTIGASNHTEKERETYDYYATEPKAAELLCDLFPFSPLIWECACGEGHLAKIFENRGYFVKATDIIDRGYGEGGIDFLKCDTSFDGDIITNPPYKYAQEFAEKALSLIKDKHHVVLMRAGGGSAVAYGWFIWEKGYHGDTIVRWFN